MRRDVAFTILTLCSCHPNAQDEAAANYQYVVAEDGPSETSNKNVFDSLGDKTFTINQKYKIVAKSEPARKPHLLVMSITQIIGKKVEQRDQVQTAFIKDGTYSMDCQHYYDVKISVPDDSIEDPKCKIKLLGVMTLDAPAKLIAN